MNKEDKNKKDQNFVPKEERMDPTSGSKQKNPRAHMKNETGDHHSPKQVVKNRLKGTGAEPSDKDGL